MKDRERKILANLHTVHFEIDKLLTLFKDLPR